MQTLVGIFVGIYMWWARRYKYSLVLGAALYCVGFGLQLRYREAQANRGLLIMVQVVQGAGSGMSGQILSTVR